MFNWKPALSLDRIRNFDFHQPPLKEHFEQDNCTNNTGSLKALSTFNRCNENRSNKENSPQSLNNANSLNTFKKKTRNFIRNLWLQSSYEELKQQQTNLHVAATKSLKNMSTEIENNTKLLTESNLTRKPKFIPKYEVYRDVLHHDLIIKSTGYGNRNKSIPSTIRQFWQNWSFLALIIGCFPIFKWLPNYSWRHSLMGDLISGITVAIMNIPHGMAYGILAGVSIECGFYMAIFPVIVYMILGTSRHISIGTFAVISMMTLKVVQNYATEDSTNLDSVLKGDSLISPLQVVTTLALTTGLIHLIMSFLRLGTLAALLSEPLVSGFTTGAACHVAVSQLKDFLGVTIPRHKGAFKIIFTLTDLVKCISETNIAAFVFCSGIMCFMILCNELIKPFLKKFCRMPFPAELIAVIGGTLISMWLNVNENYDVKLVGNIPNHLPMPELPRFELIPTMALDAVAIAIVSFSVVMSMGLQFSQKHGYEINANQELFAIGIGNCVCGFFSCIPVGCSLSRSVIQEQTGGVTQLASLISATLIIMTVFWAGPFFSALPKCVLAGVIIVALKPLFMQVKDLKKFARQGKLELLTWIGTFVCVVIVDIDIGLLVGISVSVIALYIKGIKPYSTCLGVLPDTKAIYVDLNHHFNAVELPEIKIFRYCGSLNFATSKFFVQAFQRSTGIDEILKLKQEMLKLQKKIEKTIQEEQKKLEKLEKLQKMSNEQKQINENFKPEQEIFEDNENLTISITESSNENDEVFPFHYLIFDFSMLGHLDNAGCHTLTGIMRKLNENGIRLFLAAPIDRVYDSIMHGIKLGEGPFEVFPTLHDAVVYADACRTV